jgi:serine/threonine protein kinase
MNDDLEFDQTIRSLFPGQQVFNRFNLIRQLGRGGMGVVWLAEDIQLDLQVALKFLPEVVAQDAEAIRDLKRETRKALTLTHAGIVRIYDFLTDGTNSAISMEYVEGKTLTTLKLEQPNAHFEVHEIENWVQQICEVLSYAHEKAKIAHRDLKPANIMLTENGEIKVTDFGISASISDTTTRVSMHASSSGTPVYMSPQQMMGEKAAPTDDIYSLGATIYELLTGKPPFYTGNILMQVQNKIPCNMQQRREELEVKASENIPQNWENIVAACLEKEVSERPGNIQEIQKHLSAETKDEQPPSDISEDVTVRMPIPPVSTPEEAKKTQVEKKVIISATPQKQERLSFFTPKEGKNWRMPMLKIDMIWIAPGSFVMGSPITEQGRGNDEGQHEEIIEKGFWLGKVPVTQGQWTAIMKSNPSEFQKSRKRAPVEMVSWNDAIEFCNKLNQKEKAGRRIPHGYEYSLPTEAQWEYACRAGTNTPFHYGNSLSARMANFDGRYPYGDAKKGSFKKKTLPTAKYKANAWGLYDMHGNIWEWCYDAYSSHNSRVFRGGSWNVDANHCRAAYRGNNIPDLKANYLGFRLALTPAKDPSSLDLYA